MEASIIGSNSLRACCRRRGRHLFRVVLQSDPSHGPYSYRFARPDPLGRGHTRGFLHWIQLANGRGSSGAGTGVRRFDIGSSEERPHDQKHRWDSANSHRFLPLGNSMTQNYRDEGRSEMTNLQDSEIRESVRKRYGQIAQQGKSGCGCAPSGGCCGPSTESRSASSLKVGYSVEQVQAVPVGSDLGLGMRQSSCYSCSAARRDGFGSR